jgi:hypothetical protein
VLAADACERALHLEGCPVERGLGIASAVACLQGRTSTEHELDSALRVDTATSAIDVREPDRPAFDERRSMTDAPYELSANTVLDHR